MENCLEVKNLSKSFLEFQESFVLKDITFSVTNGSFMVILGRSGCGKTTLLRILSGLELSTSGQINIRPTHSKIGFVFQEPRLMPWLNVSQNIKFLVENLSDKDVEEMLELLDIRYSGHLYPHQISVGMAQRVSIGRTLCYQPDIILMDEPFAALDYFTRSDLQDKVLQICKKLRKTIIFVTHSVDEAIFLGDYIMVIKKGVITNIFDNFLSYNQRRNSNSQVHFKQKIIENLGHQGML